MNLNRKGKHDSWIRRGSKTGTWWGLETMTSSVVMHMPNAKDGLETVFPTNRNQGEMATSKMRCEPQ